MALVLVGASAFVGARWQVAADRDLSRFVVAGSEYTSPSTGIAVEPGRGYDGQFSYRLAVDPSELQRRANGVVLDSPLRLQRITYPAISHVLALGRAELVPAALVLVNVLALGMLALLAATMARDAGRPPLAGLLVVGYFGFFTSLGRDLTEISTAVLLVSGLLAFDRRHDLLAVGLVSAAVLSRESALLLYVVYIAVQVSTGWRNGKGRLATAGLAVLPVAVFLAWQVVCRLAVGSFPLLSSSGKNLVLPFQDLLPAAAGWLRGAAALARPDLIHVGQLLTVLVVVVAAALSLRSATVAPGIKAAWAAGLLLFVSLSANVWRGPADFRTGADLHVLSALVLVGSDRSLRLPAYLLAAAAVMTALFRITSI